MNTTLMAFAACAALCAYASWKAARPVVFGKPRMLPWRTIIIISGAGAVLAMVHAVNLMGVETGRL